MTQHTTTSAPAMATGDYTKQVHFDSSPDAVFDALTTLSGLAGWWTTNVTGSGVEGGELRLAFDDADDPLLIHVDTARRPASVVWHVRSCGFLPDWVGTTPRFTLCGSSDGGCDLSFRHEALSPELECYDQCRAGWDHFLPSLRDHVESGAGRPFGAAR